MRSDDSVLAAIQFKTLSSLTAAIALILALVLFFAPELVFFLFQIEEHSSAFFIGRRAAMLFFGMSVSCWVGRNAAHSDARQAVCLGLAVSMIALAMLGTAEYLRGFAGIGIVLAIAVESFLGVAYFYIWFQKRVARATKDNIQ